MSETREPELDKPNCAPGRNRTYDTRFRKTVRGLQGTCGDSPKLASYVQSRVVVVSCCFGFRWTLSRTLRGPPHRPDSGRVVSEDARSGMVLPSLRVSL